MVCSFVFLSRLVLPEGERSAWDDILAEVLLKAPPANPLRWRRHRLSADEASAPASLRRVETVGPLPSQKAGWPYEGDAHHQLTPPAGIQRQQQQQQQPAVARRSLSSASSASSLLSPAAELPGAAAAGEAAGRGRASSGFEVDSSSADERSFGGGGQRGPDETGGQEGRQGHRSSAEASPASPPEDSPPSSAGRGEGERESAGLESAGSAWNTDPDALAMRSSADESLRERMSKIGARQQTRHAHQQRPQQQPAGSHAEGSNDTVEDGGTASLVATAGRRHLLRGPGSWTSGSGGGGGSEPGDGAGSSALLSRGHSTGGSSSLGSPSSSSNLVVTQAALGNLASSLASLSSVGGQATSSGNRESRRQSISRRLSRGASMGLGRVAPAAPGVVTDLGSVEEAEAVALGASPAAARAAADAAAATETMAIRRRVAERRLSNRRSLGLNHEVAVEAQEEEGEDDGPVALGTVLDEGVVDHRGGDSGGTGRLEVRVSPPRRGRQASRSPRADTVLESEEEQYDTPRGGRGSSASVTSRGSAGGGGSRRQDRGPSATGSESSRERGGGGGGGRQAFFGQPGGGFQGRTPRQSTSATPVRSVLVSGISMTSTVARWMCCRQKGRLDFISLRPETR